MGSRRGFTLVELLIVISVICLIATLLFPVFSNSKSAALKANCLSRFKQANEASQLYLNDYDDSFMPVNHDPGQKPNAGTDRTWVQMLYSYVGSFRTFRCPADTSVVATSDVEFDQDLLPGNLFERYYSASMHVNVGYNFQYLAPILKRGDSWISEPKTLSGLENPASMLMFIDSVWKVRNSLPEGGGNYLVSPPCRFEEVLGAKVDTITSAVVSGTGSSRPRQIYSPSRGWSSRSDLTSSNTYGGVWPWHSGRATTVTVEGSARPLTLNQLSAGCNGQLDWSGEITDRHAYLWSPD